MSKDERALEKVIEDARRMREFRGIVYEPIEVAGAARMDITDVQWASPGEMERVVSANRHEVEGALGRVLEEMNLPFPMHKRKRGAP